MDPATIPAGLRAVLEDACGGDWRRVTRAANGEYTVHNQPIEVAPKPTRVRVPCRWDKPALAPPVIDLTDSGPPVAQHPTPSRGAALPHQPPAGRPPAPVQVEVDRPILSPEVPADVLARFDWTSVDLAVTSVRLREICGDGLPEAIRYTYIPDVLALYGVDFDLLDSAVRNPHRVELRPEYADKGYAVLAFDRGDLQVIMGFRSPINPAVMAVYATSRIEHDTHRVEHHASGKKTRVKGLPKTAKAVAQALRTRGAEVAAAELTSKTLTVRYKGQELGQISTGETVDRRTAEADYQRMIRKMHGIDNARVGVAV